MIPLDWWFGYAITQMHDSQRNICVFHALYVFLLFCVLVAHESMAFLGHLIRSAEN